MYGAEGSMKKILVT